jgi:NAD+--asparagine ADP-ribosyltransferase
VIWVTNQIGVDRYQRVQRQADTCPAGFEIVRDTEMKARFSWIRVGIVAVMLLSLGNLYNSLYLKSRHVSRCGAHLAQLQLIEGQIDTTEAKLKAAESQLNRAKR